MKQYPLQEHITNRIRYLRQEKKLSQEQLSEKQNSEPTISITWRKSLPILKLKP